MAIKPILFNTDMVHAILEGRKTVTRRVVKFPTGMTGRLPPSGAKDYLYYPGGIKRPPCTKGDILYVRETWAEWAGGYAYKADSVVSQYPTSFVDRWHPSIHMPKEAARIFLRVKSVRAERLQDIDGVGQRAEGTDSKHGFGATRGAFMALWNSTIKPAERDRYGWAANPWVWVIEFERCEKPKEVSA